jgi:thioredoxin reductase (NADPH)
VDAGALEGCEIFEIETAIPCAAGDDDGAGANALLVRECAQTLIDRFHIATRDLPIVLCPNGQLLRNPSDVELARCIGLVKPIAPDKIFDVVIVGAGPAGLAASVYAGSEGLSVLALDCRAFGGQAGASARIENYLGFPTGITGLSLMARAYSQALKFGVNMAIPDEMASLQGRTAADAGRFLLTGLTRRCLGPLR